MFLFLFRLSLLLLLNGIYIHVATHPKLLENSTETVWMCPKLSFSTFTSSISCTCDIPHTLRCDGAIKSDKNQALTRLINQVKDLSPQESVTLLDISIQNLTKLPGRMFQNVSIEGLVVSSG